MASPQCRASQIANGSGKAASAVIPLSPTPSDETIDRGLVWVRMQTITWTLKTLTLMF